VKKKMRRRHLFKCEKHNSNNERMRRKLEDVYHVSHRYWPTTNIPSAVTTVLINHQEACHQPYLDTHKAAYIPKKAIGLSATGQVFLLFPSPP
jgi:hypothetical protein